MTGTRTHLPGSQCSEVGVRPTLFNSLAVCPANALCVVEGVVRLAWCAVARKVELRDVVRNMEASNVEIGVVLRSPLEVVY